MRRQHGYKPSTLVFFLLFSAAFDLRADPEESFRKGIRAEGYSKWEEAAGWMEKAIAENPQESSKPISTSGVFSVPYLPHFYRGWYLYQENRGHCEDALAEWAVSEQHGVVQGYKKQYGKLTEARDVCRGQVMPLAISTARGQLEVARQKLSAAERAQSKGNSGLGDRLKPAREQFAAAQSLFDKGSAEQRLSSVRQAETQARDVVGLIERIAGQTERLAADQLTTAVARAENAVNTAAGALRDLEKRLEDKPSASEILPKKALTQLAEARDLIRNGQRLPNLDDLHRARDQATALHVEIKSALSRLDEAPSQTADVMPTDVTPADVTPEATSTDPTPTTAPSGDAALVREIQRLSAAAEDFLQSLQAEDSSSQLFELQSSRLAALVREAQNHNPRATVQALDNLMERLADSLAALQLVAGAQAYFAGNPRQAIDILTANDLHEQLAAQGHLFRAASHYALFQIGLEDDLSQAAAEARKSSELEPELEPDKLAFSPQFRKFFAESAPR